jgi:hypothetical protein
MTYQTKLLFFYWERLGYENHYLSGQCKHVERSSAGYSSEESTRTSEIESPKRTNIQSAASEKSMG